MGLLTPWSLLGFTFLIGCGIASNNPAWQASVGDMVPRADLPAAVALNSVGFNLTRSVGPAIGGLIVATAGAAAAFAVNAMSYLGADRRALPLAPRIVPSALLPRERLGSAMGAGLRYVAMSPNILKVILRAFLFGLTSIVGAGAPAAGRARTWSRAARSSTAACSAPSASALSAAPSSARGCATRAASEAIVRLRLRRLRRLPPRSLALSPRAWADRAARMWSAAPAGC